MANHAISQSIAALAGSIPGQPAAPAIEQQPAAAQTGFRLVPASIGRPGNVQTVWITCPTWCRVSHAENREVAVEDITHYGPASFVQIGDMGDDLRSVHELYVNITADPGSSDPRLRAAHLVVADGATANDAHLSDAQAVELIADLRRLADDVEAALQTVRAANGDSDPDMDEALRRARGGRS